MHRLSQPASIVALALALLGCGDAPPQTPAVEEGPSVPEPAARGPMPREALVFVQETEEGPRTCWADPKSGAHACPLLGAYPGPPDPRGERLVVVQVSAMGQRLAWWSGDERVEGLSAWSERIRSPSWSADGSHVFYAAPGEGHSALWRQPRDGGAAELVDDHAAGNFEPVAASDGRLAFGTSRDGNAEIYVLGESGLSRQTEHPGDDVAPAWSADGETLAWLHTEGGVQRVWLRREGQARALLPELPEQLDFAWAPDGRKLAVSVLEDGQRSVRVVDVAGAELARIAVPGGAQRPAWSSDGRFLAFESSTGPDEPVVMLSHVSGKGPVAVAGGWLPRWVSRGLVGD